MEQQRPLGKGSAPVVLVHLRIDVAVDHEQVEPAVIVVIQKTVAPADKRYGGLRYAGLVADIGEAGIAVVMEQHFVVIAEVGHKKVHQSVVLVIASGNPHGRNFASVLVESEARDVTLIVEGAVAFIDVEIVGLESLPTTKSGLPSPLMSTKMAVKP